MHRGICDNTALGVDGALAAPVAVDAAGLLDNGWIAAMSPMAHPPSEYDLGRELYFSLKGVS